MLTLGVGEVTIGLTMYAAKLTPSFQTAWLGKLQNRICKSSEPTIRRLVHLTLVLVSNSLLTIAVTTSILGSMKAIKISNLGPKSSQVLETSRKDELAA